MHLTSEQFSAILASLEREESAHGADRRRTARTEQRGSLSLVLHPNQLVASLDANGERQGEFLTLAVRNFSNRGLGLLHSQWVDAGRQFTVRFHRDHGPAIRLLCTVVHCRQVNPRLYSVGAEFTCLLPAEGIACLASRQAVPV